MTWILVTVWWLVWTGWFLWFVLFGSGYFVTGLGFESWLILDFFGGSGCDCLVGDVSYSLYLFELVIMLTVYICRLWLGFVVVCGIDLDFWGLLGSDSFFLCCLNDFLDSFLHFFMPLPDDFCCDLKALWFSKMEKLIKRLDGDWRWFGKVDSMI